MSQQALPCTPPKTIEGRLIFFSTGTCHKNLFPKKKVDFVGEIKRLSP